MKATQLYSIDNTVHALDSRIIAPVYNKYVTYNPGDIVMYDNLRYKCVTKTIIGSFDKSKWTTETYNTAVQTDRTIIDTELVNKITLADVEDSLTSTATDKALSANQGKYFNDNASWKSQIVDNVLSTATDQPLSANMGKSIYANIPIASTTTAVVTPYNSICTVSELVCKKLTCVGSVYQTYFINFKLTFTQTLLAETEYKIIESPIYNTTKPTYTYALPYAVLTDNSFGGAAGGSLRIDTSYGYFRPDKAYTVGDSIVCTGIIGIY